MANKTNLHRTKPNRGSKLTSPRQEGTPESPLSLPLPRLLTDNLGQEASIEQSFLGPERSQETGKVALPEELEEEVDLEPSDLDEGSGPKPGIAADATRLAVTGSSPMTHPGVPTQAGFPGSPDAVSPANPLPSPSEVAPVNGEVLASAAGAAKNGKEPLPVLLEFEGELPDEIPLDKEEGPQADPVFDPKDEADFAKLESSVKRATRETFVALREIRRRRLYRLIQNDTRAPRYSTFDAYVADRWGHCRQWVSHGVNWLKILETAESLGINTSHLSVDAAQGLLTGRLEEAGGLVLVLEEARDDGLSWTKMNFREIVLRRADYAALSKTDGPRKPAAQTYSEYKRDSLLVKKIGKGTWGLVTDARKLPGDLVENLVRLCTERRQMPAPEELLSVATGEALEQLLAQLDSVHEVFAAVEAKKALLATREKEIRLMQQGSLRQLREEARAIREELEQQGVLAPRRKAVPQANGTPATTEEATDASSQESDNGEGDQDSTSGVREALDHALEIIDDALDCQEWPDEAEALRSILERAEHAEAKLAGITAKAKELLADAEPGAEAVPSGNQ